jgi:hypothetical protein
MAAQGAAAAQAQTEGRAKGNSSHQMTLSLHINSNKALENASKFVIRR